MSAIPWALAALLWAAGSMPDVAGEVGTAGGAGWPQWAGPLRNSSSPAAGVFGHGAVRLSEIWRRPAGWGFSALAVAGGRIFSLDLADGVDYVFALDAATGREIWRTALGPTRSEMDYGAASTPATDGRLVFALGSGCKLLALTADSGKVAWQHDLKAEFNVYQADAFGCWTSPLLAGRLLIVQVSGDPDKRVVAFDQATGTLVWSAAGAARSSRSSPTIADLAGVRQVVVHDALPTAQGGLYGLRQADGALLWSIRFPDPQSFSYDMPLVLAGDRVAMVTWSDLRTVAVRRLGDRLSAEPSWTTRDVKAEILPVKIHAVAHGGHLYGFGGEFLVCIEAATGRTVWKQKIYSGSLILVDGHLVALSQAAGLVRVVEANPAGYHEIARAAVFTPGALADTPPSFDGRRIYLRNAEEIVALEVVAAGPAAPVAERPQ